MSFHDDKLKSEPLITGKLGQLSVRLACTTDEIKAAQKLRFDVFCLEQNAQKTPSRIASGTDQDEFDDQCDHLLIIDEAKAGLNAIVGTQRFHVKGPFSNASNFYSSHEFDLAPMLEKQSNRRFMELGRSCIHPDYRDKRTMELLWHGTWAYFLERQADVMFGCASFPTTQVEDIMEPLSFLTRSHGATNDWSVNANPEHRIDIRQFDSKDIGRSVLRKLPPLIKGYLRLGAAFSTQAALDPDFGTIDILVILPNENINPRYIRHYGSSATRHRA
jgi:putative hemolysin